jgi:hypothetical protein
MNDAMISATPKKINPFRMPERSFHRLFFQRSSTPPRTSWPKL